MPVKFGMSVVNINRANGKKSISHEYMKQKTIDELVEFYNENKKPKLRRKVKIEIERRNKLGKSNIVFS
jgi:hypothetical protein